MADRSRFMRPVNVFPSSATILQCPSFGRQGLLVYRRTVPLQPALKLLITCCILVATFVRAAPEQLPNSVTEIQSVLRGQQDAWNRGDIDGFMKGYARSPSTVFVADDEVSRGWETVRERYRQKYSNQTKMGTLAFSDIEITLLSADAAVALGRWHLTRATDEPHGRFTLIFRRLPEGWRIVHDHTSAASPG